MKKISKKETMLRECKKHAKNSWENFKREIRSEEEMPLAYEYGYVTSMLLSKIEDLEYDLNQAEKQIKKIEQIYQQIIY